MLRKNIIRVAEFEKLYYDDKAPFKRKHWQALCQYQERCIRNDSSTYFNTLTTGIQFTNYVGVIQAGDLTIEVLPKTDRRRTTACNQTFDSLESKDALQRQGWHEVLLQMLKECKLINIHHVDQARLHLKSGSILDIYIELFLSETEQIVREGLIKRYRKTEENLFTLKGQLKIARNIAQNSAHQERFYVAHTTYSRTNIYNQLLYKTLLLIPSLSNNQSILGKVNRLLLSFPIIPDCKVSAVVFDKLILDRKTERYRNALQICKMLLLNYRPDTKGGTKDVLAILFDMNKLWEEFVYRRLIKCASTGIRITRQERKLFWNNVTSGYNKHVKPDIVVDINGRKIILDTKWKIPINNKPSDDDLKQMFVYNLLWDASTSMLIYPGNQSTYNGSYPHFPLSSSFIKNEGEEIKYPYYNHCSLYFLNILEKNGSLVGLEPFEELLGQL